MGICEQHSFAFAEGLAISGMLPVVAHYSTFAQRGFDQLFQEIVLQRNLGIVVTDKEQLYEFACRLIRKGEPIAMLFPSANRDTDVFERPDEFDIDRKPNKHLAFGRGAHKCVAAAMARLELRVTLEELLGRTASFELDGEVQMASWLEFGPSSVPLRMTLLGTRHG